MRDIEGVGVVDAYQAKRVRLGGLGVGVRAPSGRRDLMQGDLSGM